jgi:broad specificity phosphatase PhoE
MSRTLQEKLGARTCFIQISVDDEFGEQYIADLCKFRGVSLEQSKALIAQYRDRMESIQEDGSEGDTPYIHLINYNEMMVVNKMMQGFVGSEVCHYLSNLHPYEHIIYLSRHGESIFNVEKRMGGDSGLSKRGEEYARRLAEFVKYVQCGRADSIVCVTLTQEELRRLPEHVTETPQGLVASGGWDGFGDASGAVVEAGMRLLRIQAGYGADFQDAPGTVQEVAKVAGSSYPTLIFVQGDASEPGLVPGRLWTSSLKRTIETARFIEHNVVPGKNGKPWTQMEGRQLRNIDEVYAGEFDGLTEEDIKRIAPEVTADRSKDKMGFRYPRGESYYDILARLSGAMVDLERVREPILIVSHQAVLRLICAWMTKRSREEAIKMSVPQHDVIRITYDGLSRHRDMKVFPLGPRRLLDDGQSNL